jgi:hypothetical protein
VERVSLALSPVTASKRLVRSYSNSTFKTVSANFSPVFSLKRFERYEHLTIVETSIYEITGYSQEGDVIHAGSDIQGDRDLGF